MKKTLFGLVMLSVLGACGPSPQSSLPQEYPQQVQQAPAQPVIVNNAPAASHGDGMLTGGLLGAAAGYMLGKGSNAAPHYDSQPTRVIERRTTIIKHVQTPAATPAAPAAPAAAPAPQKVTSSSYGSAYAATKPSAPSAPSRSSSYGSVSRSSGRR